MNFVNYFTPMVTFIISLFLFVPSQGFAENSLAPVEAGYEKNGWPCVKEICLNDGIEELKRLEWEDVPVQDHLSMYATDLGYLVDRTTVESALFGHLIRGLFDGSTIPLLATIATACYVPQALEGTLDGGAENRTTVRIQLRPDEANPRNQRWTVVNIIKNVPSAFTTKQQEEVLERVALRYGKFYVSSGRSDILRRVNEYRSSGFGYELSGFGPYLSGERDDWLQAEACGGGKAVEID